MINQTQAEIVVNEVSKQIDKIGFFPFLISVVGITVIGLLIYFLDRLYSINIVKLLQRFGTIRKDNYRPSYDDKNNLFNRKHY